MRLGWAHLSYGFREQAEPTITEMFVWPAYRRHGIATALQDAAEQLVRDWGPCSVDLHIHEADAVGCRTQATSVAQALGYQLRKTDARRPNLALVGSKALR